MYVLEYSLLLRDFAKKEQEKLKCGDIIGVNVCATCAYRASSRRLRCDNKAASCMSCATKPCWRAEAFVLPRLTASQEALVRIACSRTF